MMQKISAFISNNRRFIPLTATAVLFFVAYAIGAIFYEGMRDPQVFLNLFRTSPFLLISAIGMTFVILTGGIDLSVSGVVALTTVAAAALLRDGWNAWVVIVLMLAMGMALGAIMGSFITYMKVQPFIATLAGMWFARGMCFFISDDAIAIDNRLFRILGLTKILIPGLSDPATKQGDFISILVVIALLVFVIAIYIAHYTRFGRTVYAIGGNEGRNEQSARLMGLPASTTKLLVYTLNGFCSALAGLTLSIYVASGHGLYAQTFELDVIASVVMGGTMLTGGQGYVFGTLFGVLITGLTQTLIQFNGQLSSWWTRIVIGALTLIFISVQSLLAARKGGRRRAAAREAGAPAPETRRNRRLLLIGGTVGAVIAIVLAVFAINSVPNAAGESAANTATLAEAACQFKPFRQDQAANLIKGGAVIAYERNGGPNCIDELYAIYPDGRIVGDDGGVTIEKQVTLAEVEQLLAGIHDYGWFSDEMYNTWHTPCGQCYGYYLTVAYNDQEKTVKGVDGGTDAPADYWQVISLVKGIVPKFTSQ
ncbi:MAG TPA: galactofuranose ABC transporter, permease protein YjfF [Anaerolineae bacterium]|nr:galactofuranose ABC transporter, permease protein YjfF [Anaerolineae bacterium]